MGKSRSLVWQFFDRILDKGKPVTVECKLCDTEYKYFGNTTNLKGHLTRRHPLQWEIAENGGLHETARKRLEEAGEKDVCYSITISDDVDTNSNPGKIPKIEIHRLDNTSDVDQDTEATTEILVRDLHKESDEEWLEDPFHTAQVDSYEPPRKKRAMKIKREPRSPAPRISRLQSSQLYDNDLNERTIIIPADPQPIKDEYSVFGEYIANKMRKFKSPRTRGNLQQVITTMLWQAEYGVYDNSEAVKRIIMFPMDAEQSNSNVSSGKQSEVVDDPSDDLKDTKN